MCLFSVYGVHGKVENIMAYCIYLDNPAYPTLEADTCVPLKEAYPETTYLDGNLVIDDNGGTVCTCDQYGCNHPDGKATYYYSTGLPIQMVNLHINRVRV